MVLRLQGLLLFLVLPLAIYLLVSQPCWPLPALLVGVGLLLSHRFLASPFVRQKLWQRCVWTGAEIAPGCEYRIRARGGEWVFRAFSERERDRAARFFTFCHRYAWLLRIVFLGPLAFYVVMEILRLTGIAGGTSSDVNRMVFLGTIGLACLLVYVACRLVEPIPHHAKEIVSFPFGVHVFALLGISWTLLIFAFTGAWWIATLAVRLTGPW
jgi:hypothetical protein